MTANKVQNQMVIMTYQQDKHTIQAKLGEIRKDNLGASALSGDYNCQ